MLMPEGNWLSRLDFLRGQDAVVLGLPRGGVPVAFEVARALRAPLDVLLVRKLGVPFHPELAFGAIGEGGVRVLNRSVMSDARLSGRQMAAVEDKERAELQRRSERFRGDHPPISLKGRVAVIIDDGIATGSTARAACQVARAKGASRVVLASSRRGQRHRQRVRRVRRRGGMPRNARAVLRRRSGIP